MAVYASVLFTDPMPADMLAMIVESETPPTDILMTVVQGLEHYGVRSTGDDVPPPVAEEAVDRLLSVATGLMRFCDRPEDTELYDAINHWLMARGRF